MKMKKWQIILSIAAAVLVLAVTPLAILAQDQVTPRANSRAFFKGGLAIVAPGVVLSSQRMQLTVFLRINQRPVPNAGVWAVTGEKIEALKNEVKTLREQSGANAAEADYEALATLYGVRLGRTDAKGRLTHTFNDPGNYLLVAFKKGYYPDFSGLAVRGLPKALVILAPRRASPGEPFTITVNQKGTKDGVQEAGVWAISEDDAQALKDKLAALREANKNNPDNVDWEAVLNDSAISLGQTNGDGQLNAELADQGKYLLVAFKKGYWPGYNGIAIGAPQPTTNTTALRISKPTLTPATSGK